MKSVGYNSDLSLAELEKEIEAIENASSISDTPKEEAPKIPTSEYLNDIVVQEKLGSGNFGEVVKV